MTNLASEPPPEPEPPPLTRAELEKLERQLIPLLNTIRKLLGKEPLSTR
jgi:hypothetical protein